MGGASPPPQTLTPTRLRIGLFIQRCDPAAAAAAAAQFPPSFHFLSLAPWKLLAAQNCLTRSSLVCPHTPPKGRPCVTLGGAQAAGPPQGSEGSDYNRRVLSFLRPRSAREELEPRSAEARRDPGSSAVTLSRNLGRAFNPGNAGRNVENMKLVLFSRCGGADVTCVQSTASFSLVFALPPDLGGDP